MAYYDNLFKHPFAKLNHLQMFAPCYSSTNRCKSMYDNLNSEEVVEKRMK